MTDAWTELDDAPVTDPVVAAFEKFDRTIRPSNASVGSIYEELQRLSDVLGKASFETRATGSQVRATAVADLSDIDLLAIAKRPMSGQKSEPQEILRSLESILMKSGLPVDRTLTTVSVDLGGDLRVDITPATVRPIANHNDYLVPDVAGKGWIGYAPRLHDALVEDAVTRLGPHFRPMVRMLKWWSKHHSNAWQSFAIEGLVNEVFRSDIPAYPLAVSEYFASDSVTASTDRSALGALRESRNLAQEAVGLSMDEPGACSRASELWRGVFGDRFPRISA